MRPTTTRHLAMPAAASGLLMAAYLLLRPYGDGGSATTPQAAAAFASSWWVVAHLAGALSLVQLARVGLRINDLLSTTTTRLARWSGLAGAVLVLPYFGAETFALHAIGRLGPSDPQALSLVDQVRNHPAALTSFGLGLALLAVSALATALAWHGAVRAGRWTGPTWAGWPLALTAALVLPQFYLPPTGRMAFGLVYAAAALLLAVSAWRAPTTRAQSPTTFFPRATTCASGAKTIEGSLPS
ncbi:hypothetical protein [Janibacter alittae]|uniref:Uncharacterized protein n=1 Tax=Janibacter alittae TaxID=3115209 RepID=A0ABZ2MGV8_9MICO